MEKFSIYVSPNGHWFLTISNQALSWWYLNPLVTIFHVPTGTNQEVEFKNWKQWYSQLPSITASSSIPSQEEGKSSLEKEKDGKQQAPKYQKGTESIVFAKDEKSQIQYAIITYQGMKTYLALEPHWVEEVDEAQICENLHLDQLPTISTCRLVLEGKVAKICHPTKVNAPLFAEIQHDVPLLSGCLLNEKLVFTLDSSFLGKLTRLQ